MNLAYDLKLCIYMFKKVDNYVLLSTTFQNANGSIFFWYGGGGVFVEPLFSKSGAFKCPSKEEFDILQDFFSSKSIYT